MSNLHWLTDEQMARLDPYFEKPWQAESARSARAERIIFVKRNRLRWRDAPTDYGPHKTL